MRILVNATSARLGGGITVLRKLLPALAAEDGGRNEYFVIAHAETARAVDPKHPRITFDVRHPGDWLGARVLWEQVQLPVRARRGHVDLIFSLGGLAVFAARGPQVVMYQNMAPFEPRVVARAPATERRRLRLLKDLGRLSGRVATRVVFISRYAERSILPQIGGAPRGHCVHLGRDPSFRPDAASRAPEVLARCGISSRYLLSVSQFYFYKNFVELVEAFARALPSIPADIVLAIAGAEHQVAYAEEVRSRIRLHRLGDRVRLLGAVPYEDLPALYAASQAFVFPSTVENFPNILVEALASGAPTFASRLEPMPEIAGDGAAYFDPSDPDDIARSIVEACLNDELRERLRERGLERVRRYSWEKTARELLAVFEAAV